MTNKLRALKEFTHALAGSYPVSELVQLAVDKAQAGTGADAAEIFLVEESTGQSLLACHRGLLPQAFHEITQFSPGAGYPGLIAVHGEIIATDNLPEDKRYLRIKVKEAGFRSYFCLPLFYGERILGCLNLANRSPGKIRNDDREFLHGIGSGLSLALEARRWRLAEALDYRQETGQSGITLEGAVNSILETIATECRCQGAALFFVATPGKSYQLLAKWGSWQPSVSFRKLLPEACPARISPRFSPCPVPDCLQQTGISVCHLLTDNKEVMGVLHLDYHKEDIPPVEVFFLLPRIAALLTPKLKQLQHYYLAREQATKEERQRLTRELHDSIVQSLVLLRVKTEYLSQLIARAPEKLAEELKEIHHLAGDTLEELRGIVSSSSAQLQSGELISSLRNLAQRLEQAYHVPVRFGVEGEAMLLSPSIQLHLLRFAQEALSNALRHSETEQVDLELKLAPSGYWLTVRDGGRGFDPDKVRQGMGLLNMKERACSLGGKLIIDSAPQRGTVLQIWLPAGR